MSSIGETAKEFKLIAIYARVSTARQEEEKTIETQLGVLREFAASKGYNIVKEYIDNGWSGDLLARPQLDQLRQDAKTKIWEAVLAYDPDRLARRYSYQELVTDELREAGIEVLFVTTPSPKNGEEKILHGVKGLFAEYERMKIGERFRLGKLRKVKEGHVLTSEAPYGLRYIPRRDKEHGYYEVNEDEIQHLRLIFQLVDGGLTMRGVVRKLQELGIKPRKSARGVWNTSALGRILRNTTYIGEATYGRGYAVVPDRPLKTEKYKRLRKTSRRLRPESEWIKIRVLTVLNRELFQRVQVRLRKNAEFSQRNRKNEYLLAGKIWCTCGCRRAGEGPQRGKYLYYRCTNKVHTFPMPPTCGEAGVNARTADFKVWDCIAHLMSSPEMLADQANRWLNQKTKSQGSSHSASLEMREQVRKLREREDRYNKAYGAGLFSIEKLKKYLIPIRNQISALEVRIASVEASSERASYLKLPTTDEIERFAEVASRNLFNLNFTTRQAIVRNIVHKIVGTKEELRIYGAVQVGDSNYVELQTNHRYGVDTTRHGIAEEKGIPFEVTINLNQQVRTGEKTIA